MKSKPSTRKIPVPAGTKGTDRFLGTVKTGGKVLHMTAGPRVPLVWVDISSAAASMPDAHTAQPRLHMNPEQARELATLLLAGAELAEREAGPSAAIAH